MTHDFPLQDNIDLLSNILGDLIFESNDEFVETFY